MQTGIRQLPDKGMALEAHRDHFSNSTFQSLGLGHASEIAWAQEVYGVSQDATNPAPQKKGERKSVIEETREELLTQGRMPEPISPEEFTATLTIWKEAAFGTAIDLAPGVSSNILPSEEGIAA